MEAPPSCPDVLTPPAFGEAKVSTPFRRGSKGPLPWAVSWPCLGWLLLRKDYLAGVAGLRDTGSGITKRKTIMW